MVTVIRWIRIICGKSVSGPYKTSIGKGQFLLGPDNSEIQISTLPPFFSGPKGVDNVPLYAPGQISRNEKYPNLDCQLKSTAPDKIFQPKISGRKIATFQR